MFVPPSPSPSPSPSAPSSSSLLPSSLLPSSLLLGGGTLAPVFQHLPLSRIQHAFVVDAVHPYSLLTGPRGSGKTHAGVVKTLNALLLAPGARGLAVGGGFLDLRVIEICLRAGLSYRYNPLARTVTLTPNESVLTISTLMSERHGVRAASGTQRYDFLWLDDASVIDLTALVQANAAAPVPCGWVTTCASGVVSSFPHRIEAALPLTACSRESEAPSL